MDRVVGEAWRHVHHCASAGASVHLVLLRDGDRFGRIGLHVKPEILDTGGAGLLHPLLGLVLG